MLENSGSSIPTIETDRRFNLGRRTDDILAAWYKERDATTFAHLVLAFRIMHQAGIRGEDFERIASYVSIHKTSSPINNRRTKEKEEHVG